MLGCSDQPAKRVICRSHPPTKSWIDSEVGTWDGEQVGHRKVLEFGCTENNTFFPFCKWVFPKEER